ncbi:MAG: hypothetical protein U0W40_04235 [Acidimicrobiia bacterium]
MVDFAGFTPVDEQLHAHDPADWSWNESWFFSFVDLDGGPACTFRVGVLPNQGRAMLWCFLYVDGAWVTVEESRLAWDGFDFSRGVAYDQWAISFASRDDEPFTSGRFTFEGAGLVRSGPQSGRRVPFTIDLEYRAAGDVHGSGHSDADTAKTTHPIGRFEQPLTATGTVTVGEQSFPVRAGAHRDKSWGPRDWRIGFLIGDLQSEHGELYFVGAPADPVPRVGGYLRASGSSELVRLACVEGSIELDDAHATVAPVHLVFETPGGERVEVDMAPVGPSAQFDMAHTCEVPEHWLYWRHLVEARVSAWDGPARGWFEASRYGA